uniref:O-antigen ligase n=1 Tax=mine drainage metagenome TaxID=410659 RepID=E6QLJ1_9ZZZZ
MEITPIGWILIPLGVILFFANPTWLYVLTIFFAPFSATAVVNIGSGEATSGVQAYLMFATLLITQKLLNALLRLKVGFPKKIRKPLWLLFLFVATCLASLVMPLWINGRLQITSPLLTDMATTPLIFSSTNITGVVYLVIGTCLTAIVAKTTLDAEKFHQAVKIYVISGVFISLWAVLQLTCGIAHIPYPAAIFNSSKTPSALGYAAELELVKIPKISSVAVESSMLAASLLTMIPLGFASFFGSGYVLGRRLDKWIFGLMVVALVLSTSSTAYVGVCIFLLLGARYLVKFHRLHFKYALLVIVLIAVALTSYALVPQVQLIAQELLLNKASGYSALERAKTIYYAFGYFTQYPILGVGWSSVTSHDTIVKLLSNCGILGLLAFSAFIFSIARSLQGQIGLLATNMHNNPFDNYALIMFIVLIMMLSIAVMDGFPYVFGHFWVVLGLAISAPNMHGNDAYFLNRKNVA